jgi:hypothetical protein
MPYYVICYLYSRLIVVKIFITHYYSKIVFLKHAIRGEVIKENWLNKGL